MSAAQFPEPAALMPHKQDAVLLDEITLATVDRIEARLVVRDGSAFSDSGGNLPAWVGIVRSGTTGSFARSSGPTSPQITLSA